MRWIIRVKKYCCLTLVASIAVVGLHSCGFHNMVSISWMMKGFPFSGISMLAAIPSPFAPMTQVQCRPLINVPEGVVQINVNMENTSCLFTFYKPGENRSAPPYDQQGAMRFSASVIAIYGLSIALLIGMTLKRNETDYEVKGFLRSFAKLDIYRKRSEKNKMKQTLSRFHAGIRRVPERGTRSRRSPSGGISKARNRQRRRSHERLMLNINAIQLVERRGSKESTPEIAAVDSSRIQSRNKPLIHRSALPLLDELDEECLSSTSGFDTDSVTSTVWCEPEV